MSAAFARDAALRWGEGSARRRLGAATAVLFLAGLLALGIVPGRAAEANGPHITGTLPRFGADAAKALGVADLQKATDPTTQSGVGLIYPKLDRLYQLYNLSAGPHAGALAVVERSLATLAVTRTLFVPGRTAMMVNGDHGAEWVSTFDTKTDHLYLAYTSPGSVAANLSAPASSLPGLLGIDLRSLAYSDSQFPNFLASSADTALVITGLQFDETTDTLLALQEATRTQTSAANALLLVGWKASDVLKGGPLPQTAPRPVRACKRDPVSDADSPYLTPMLIASGPDPDAGGVVKTWLTFPCYSTADSSNVVIVRLDRATALQPNSADEKAVVAPAGVLNWAADVAHGRLYLANNSAETDGWVYEVASNAFVGVLALSPRHTQEAGSMAMGVDEASGRLYLRAPSYGLMISAAAQDPVPQADVYPGLAAGGSYRLLVDPTRNRLFSLTGTPTTGGAAAAYQVISVPRPLPAPPKADPDSRTRQVAETPGKTTPLYGGNASAYGLRVLLSRGVSGAVPTNGSNDAGQLLTSTDSRCGFTDRELVLAHVSRTEFSDTSRFARAAALDPDDATVVDASRPSRCDVYNGYNGPAPLTLVTPFLRTDGVLGASGPAVDQAVAPQTGWDYQPADCTTKGGRDAAGPHTKALAGSTSVACTDDRGISAAAESRLKPVDSLDVSVSRATSATSVRLDPKRGLVTTATARLENVRIGDISIGYLTSTATSFAHGRTGTAGTSFGAPEVGFVSGPGVPTCTTNCNIDAVVNALNTALAGRAEIRRVFPETDLAKGSPGGYEAGILKSDKQQASDASLSGDRSVEVPALELVVYNDNPSVGRARQVYQLAGVRADSHYGIELLSPADCGSCAGTAVGTVLNVGTGGTSVSSGAGPAAGSRTPLAVHLPNEGAFHRFIRQTAAGADYSLRIIFSSPRQAAVMATVWALLWGPWIAFRRRRALRAVASADPEGPMPR
jgi:hypothetical protein